MSYSPRGHKKSDMTEDFTFTLTVYDQKILNQHKLQLVKAISGWSG